MAEYFVSWNERIFYEAAFDTDAEECSPEWWDALFAARECLDSNGMDDVSIEVNE
jgi:hypothetical protein